MKENICKCCVKKFDDEEYIHTKDMDRCILHCSKDNWTIEQMKYFWNCISEMIFKVSENYEKYKDTLDEVKEDYNYEMYKYQFSNIIFPKFGEYFISFNQIPFEGLNKNLDIIFNDCIFSDSTSFDLIHNAKNVNFQNCKFEGQVVFTDVKFSGNFLFENCKLNEESLFKSVIFEGITSFIHSSSKSSFKLQHCRFNDSCLLNLTKFDTFLLDNTYFRKESNFLNMNVISINRETARIIKDSFEHQNNIIEANRFYALEMIEREKELKFYKEPFEWLVFKIHGLSSNHSQNWILALFWIINITFLANYFTYEFSCDNSVQKYLDRILFFSGSLTLIGYGITKLKEKYINISLVLFTLFSYFIYSSSYIDDGNLKEFSNMINPFSIMTEASDLGFFTLLYKITIAYLIYQLIISIRQNTRRK